MRKPARKEKHSTQKLPVPEPGEGKRGVEGHLGYLLRQAGAAQRARTDRALADLGVTTPQFAVLTMLHAYPGISNADTARLSMLTPQTVSVIVANLEKAGWIGRRPHEVHGRIQHIDVTDAGRKVLAQCRSRIEATNRRMAAGLTAAEEKIVRRWLVDIARETVQINRHGRAWPGHPRISSSTNELVGPRAKPGDDENIM